MEPTHFDALARALAASRSRRGLSQLLGALALAAPLVPVESPTALAKRKKRRKKKRGTAPTNGTTGGGGGSISPPPPPRVVISQIYAHGGSMGAAYTHDYIEIFNRGTTPIVINNWSVQFSAPNSADWNVTTLTGRTIPPGGYLLVQELSEGMNGLALPQPDFQGNTDVLTGSGKIALVTSTTPLDCGSGLSCVTAPGVIDFLGYGNLGAPGEGGAPAVAPGSTGDALFRDDNGCTDTNNNAQDFSLADPSPRNSGFVTLCP